MACQDNSLNYILRLKKFPKPNCWLARIGAFCVQFTVLVK